MRYTSEKLTDKRRQILAKASLLFRQFGFEGVSVRDAMKATGMTHGAFYSHFKSKEHLISQAIGVASEDSLDAMKDFERDPQTQLEFIRNYLTARHRDDPGQGCIMTTLAMDVARMPTMRPEFTQHVRGVLRSLMAPFSRSDDETIRQESIRKMSLMVGAIVLARAVDDPGLSDDILRLAREFFE